MAPHEERVLKEKEELDDKIQKLSNFIFGEDLLDELEVPPAEQDRLMRQYRCMVAYSGILNERIIHFEPEKAKESGEETT